MDIRPFLKRIIAAAKEQSAPYERLSKEVWTFLALTVLSLFVTISFVNLTPTVENAIFFSSDDPQFQSEHLINRLFIRQDAQLIVSATGDIFDKVYQNRVAELSKELLNLDGVSSVTSLTHFGPANLSDALKSPLWKRLIISDDQKSSNLIVLIDETRISEMVGKIEVILNTYRSDDFQIRVAGMPYVIELIKRNLKQDLTVFSVIAMIIFGFLIFSFFHSRKVLLGTVVAALNACMWTFMIAQLLQIPMGLLTANLGTIIFVMTLSHIIFLTYNWRHFCSQKTTDPVGDAVRRTFPPAFWSMLTTFLGFMSLFSVPAKPLRDLGVLGAIGSLVAILVAYVVFPSFLKLGGIALVQSRMTVYQGKLFRFLDRRRSQVALGIFISLVLVVPGLPLINSDPSLLSYFADNSEIYKGLSYIDRNGGSSPLILVVRSSDSGRLNTDRNYAKLWDLQEALEHHRSVGSVISLPVLIAQAKNTPLGWMLSQELLLSAMESPAYSKIASSFVTKDRKYGLFLLRMNERHRSLSRVKIIQEIRDLAEIHGFYPEIMGGVYKLQGQLAKLVVTSLVFGLTKLLLLFGIIAWLVSRSLRIALAVVGAIVVIPLTILGLIGIYRVPLDIISAPACNVAIAMGIDSMIHMIRAFRQNGNWQSAREEMSQPVLTSTIVVSLGFAIFLLSTSPPTQRFGAAIMFGTILAALCTLFIMPLLFEYARLDRFKTWLLHFQTTVTSPAKK
jgi:predicted RND superfamily exporter protein